MLSVVGLGPGDSSLLTPQALDALVRAEVVVGYKRYVELVDPDVLAGKEILTTGMTGEMERCRLAVERAGAGQHTVVVCGGDAGVYGLSGLVLELMETAGLGQSLPVEVIPGIPALCAAAALLGAPLVHDFASVSLSDLLTPWERIEQRIKHAALGDFVLAIYNPKSKKRHWQLDRAREILLEHKDPSTPVGIVRQAFRPEQDVRITDLKTLDPGDVDMLSILIVGNSQTRVLSGRMVTPRGYFGKYGAP